MITSAPSARSSRAFSCDILSGMVKTQRYPFTAVAYTGVRIPCVTRFSRTSGVQPMVSRILPYGLAWDGIRVRLRRAVRDGARRVLALRDGVPFRRRRVTPRRADRSHRRGDWRRSRTRGVRLPLRHGPARLRVAELDRLEERSEERRVGKECRL